MSLAPPPIETNNNFNFKLPIRLKDEMKNDIKDISRVSTRDIPYLPPEIMETIAQHLLIIMKSKIICEGENSYAINKHDNEYTLLNIFIVFPYLLPLLKPILTYKIDWEWYYNDIPLYIYNFIYIKIDNVYDKLVMLFENLKDIYSLDKWVWFITCEDSPFYKTNEGKRFVCYILNQYTNHQKKKMDKQLLCNLLNHSDIIPIPKSINNIIFNKLVYNFKLTTKLNLSLLTNKEKILLLRYNLINYNYRNINSDYDATIYLISVFKIYSTKIIDILSDNIYFIGMHQTNQNSLIHYILKNYTNDNYLLGSFIKYYLSVILKLYYISDLAHSLKTTFTTTYHKVIGPILGKALKHKHTALIRLLLNLTETTKFKILYIISYDDLYKDIENLNLASEYIINVYYKYTFTFDDLSICDWTYNVNDDSKTIVLKLFLYKIAEEKINNIHNLNKDLLYKIYNYMVYHFNRLNINLIFNKSYSLKGNSNDSITRVSTYSNSIVDKIESLQLKNDIDNMYKYITKYYNLVQKCAFIIKLMEKQSPHNDNIIGIDKNESKKYNKKLLYIYNIYNYILKHKLYNETKLNLTMKRICLLNIKEINNSKFNINIIDFNNITTTSFKKTSLNRKIVSNMLMLKEYLNKVIEIINKN